MEWCIGVLPKSVKELWRFPSGEMVGAMGHWHDTTGHWLLGYFRKGSAQDVQTVLLRCWF